MPAESSADRASGLPGRVRAAMMLIGFVPLVHTALTVTPVLLVIMGRPRMLLALAPVALYLLPPAIVRLVTWRRPLPTGLIDLASPEFLRWWFTAQCQIVFARLPWLDELLRLVPTLYSAWLRLWGSRVGAFVYWSPGLVILDRSLVNIGSRVVFGAGVRLNPHAIAPIGGRRALILGPVTIGDDALIGGYSTLLPGCIVSPGEVTAPFRTVHPFMQIEGGRRSRVSTLVMTDDLDALAG
jgi:hypothetical protein